MKRNIVRDQSSEAVYVLVGDSNFAVI